MRFIQPKPVQATACIGFQVVHDSLWTSFRFHDYMDMVGSNMAGKQIPLAILAPLQHGTKYCLPATLIHFIGQLFHPLALLQDALGIGF